MDSAQYMDLLNSLSNTPPSDYLSEDWSKQTFPSLGDDLNIGMPLSIPIPSSELEASSRYSPTAQSSTSSVPSLVSPTSDNSSPVLFTPPPLQESIPTIRVEGSIFGAMQETYLNVQKPTPASHLHSGSPTGPTQQRRMSTPILTEVSPRRLLRRPSTLQINPVGSQQYNPFLMPAEPVRRSVSDSSSALPSPMPLLPVARSKTLMGAVQSEYEAFWPDLMQSSVLSELPPTAFSQPTPWHYNISGVNLGTEDLGMLDQVYQPSYYTYDNLPASAPAWRSSFDLSSIPAALPQTPPPDFYVTEQAHTPYHSLLEVPFRPASAPLARNFSDGLAGQKPVRPLPKRRVTASASPQPAKRRMPAGPAQFVNFTSADASKLLNGVAPSGSSKRKREEEALHQTKRRVVTV